MDVMDARRRLLMMQTPTEQWDYIFRKTDAQTTTWFLDVTEGQTITVKWESPETQNLNGWVMNANGCCEDITQIRAVGMNGERTLQITASGQVRIAGYSNANTFNLAVGSVVYVRLI